MSQKIKVGDTVKCVRRRGAATGYLHEGHTYQVRELLHGELVLDGVEHPHGYWLASRFEVVENPGPAFVLLAHNGAVMDTRHASLAAAIEYLRTSGMTGEFEILPVGALLRVRAAIQVATVA